MIKELKREKELEKSRVEKKIKDFSEKIEQEILKKKEEDKRKKEEAEKNERFLIWKK